MAVVTFVSTSGVRRPELSARNWTRPRQSIVSGARAARPVSGAVRESCVFVAATRHVCGSVPISTGTSRTCVTLAAAVFVKRNPPAPTTTFAFASAPVSVNAAFVQNVMPYTYAVPLTVADAVPAEKNSFAVPSVRSGAAPPSQLPSVVSRPSPAAPVHTYVSPAVTGALLRTRSAPLPVMCSPTGVPSFFV